MRPLWVVAALAIALGGYVHLRIWQHEYRHAPIREMFVANWLVSAVVAALLVGAAAFSPARHRLGDLVLLAGLVLSVGTLVAFAASLGPGLPTLHGTFKEHGIETTASYVFALGSAKVTLATETVAAIACGAGLLVSARA